MNKTIPLLLLLCLTIFAAPKEPKETKKSWRVNVGPTVSSPLSYEGALYFLATTGLLLRFEENDKKLEKIFQTEKSSVSGLTIESGIAYFGEGVHEDKKANIYAVDLKTKKLLFKKEVTGHIERNPVVKDGALFVSMGPGGFGSLNLETRKWNWIASKVKESKIHSDSNPIFYKGSVCISSVYEFKGVVCLNQASGVVTHSQKLKYSAKSELGLSGSKLFGFAHEADLVKSKWDTPSVFYIIDLEKKKTLKEVELRGFNFYAPELTTKTKENEAFVSLSTGDIITVNLTSGKITYVYEFPEPFISSTFKYKEQLCALGVMGKLLCFKKTKKGFALSNEKRYFETPIGKIKESVNGKLYIPSRIGFFNL